MRKPLRFWLIGLLVLCLCWSNAFGAVYVRYVTTGAGAQDINGGGQQLGADDAYIYRTTDATSAGDGLTITDNVATWGTTAVGDGLCFWTDTGTPTKNQTRVTALNVGGDAHVISVSPAVALATANKPVNVGGAFATLARSCAVAVAGEEHRWCGNWTIAAALGATNMGTVTAPVHIIGYAADKSAPALITVTMTGANGAFNLNAGSATDWTFQNIDAVKSHVSNTSAVWDIRRPRFRFITCKARFSSAARGDGFYFRDNPQAGHYLEAYNCSRGIYALSTAGCLYLDGISVHDCSVAGVLSTDGTLVLRNFLIFGNTGIGLSLGPASGGYYFISDGTIASNTSHGIDVTTTTCVPVIANVSAIRNGGYGASSSVGASTAVMYGCHFPASGADANTAGGVDANFTIFGSALAANLTGSQIASFISVIDGSEDFRPDKNSALIGIGYPGLYPGFTGELSKTYITIGGVKRKEVYPAEADVEDTVLYGQNDEYEGDLVAGGGAVGSPDKRGGKQ